MKTKTQIFTFLGALFFIIFTVATNIDVKSQEAGTSGLMTTLPTSSTSSSGGTGDSTTSTNTPLKTTATSTSPSAPTTTTSTVNPISTSGTTSTSGSTTSTSSTTNNTSTSTTSTSTSTTSNNDSDAPDCNYTYSDWGACTSSGVQYRQVKSKSPSGCQGNPDTQRSCTYQINTSTSTATSTATSTTGNNTATGTAVPTSTSTSTVQPSETSSINSPSTANPAGCAFIYSEWKACQSNGYKYREILSQSPSGCFGNPETKSPCAYTQTLSEISQTLQTIKTSGDSTNGITTQSWQEKYFGSKECSKENYCDGKADPDNDGLSNNDEYRMGSDPLKADTDGDGKNDGNEVASQSNPLKKVSESDGDKISFESPKEAGEIESEKFKVEKIELTTKDSGEKSLSLKGKGIPNSYVNIYIYSETPRILTVKTNASGDWEYLLEDNLDEGNHEVYVALTDSTGKVQIKSEPLPFIKTAQAVNVISPIAAATSSEIITPTAKEIAQPTPKEKILNPKDILFIISVIIAAFFISLISINRIISKNKKPNDQKI